MAKNQLTNVTDVPLQGYEDDSLGQGNYINALASFIRRAETPMTIAVQGEWGCGKTSLMNALADQVCLNFGQHCPKAVRENDEPPIQRGPFLGVWINTWQYSVLKSDTEAQVSVIRGVARELTSQMDQLMGSSSTIQEIGRKLGSSIGALALTAAKVGVSAAGLNPLALNNMEEVIRTQENGPEYFRRKLAASVKAYLEEYNSKRRSDQANGIIFFIDDLDRLDPPVAVQVLSLLKNLFEVPNCIFVLAIDYEVVVQGLASRFGQRTDQNEREFRSFFDKIIQLTFRVPMESYQIDKFLQGMLTNIAYAKESDFNNAEFLKTIVDITLNSAGRNPRSIKRMVNTLSLVREIHKIQPPELESLDRRVFLMLLYGLVSIQSAYPRLYDELIKKPNLYDWLSDTNSSPKEVADLRQEFEEDLTAAGFVLDDAILADPWIRKRQKNIQSVLFTIFSVVMRHKFAREAKNPGTFATMDVLRTTKDYLNQIIQASRLTLNTDEGGDGDITTLEDFLSACTDPTQKHPLPQKFCAEIRLFAESFNKVFDNQLELAFADDRILFNAVRDPGRKNSRRMSICTLMVIPDGFIIRSRWHRIGVGSENNRAFRKFKSVETVRELVQEDLKPMIARYRDFTGAGRVANSWTKVMSLALEEADADDDSDSAESTLEAAGTSLETPALSPSQSQEGGALPEAALGNASSSEQNK